MDEASGLTQPTQVGFAAVGATSSRRDDAEEIPPRFVFAGDSRYNFTMVKLYRENISPQADAIEAELREMVFGFDRVVIEPKQAAQLFGDGHTLPVITNNERVVSGDGIAPYLRELQKLMLDWQAFQGDYCYVDDEGDAC